MPCLKPRALNLRALRCAGLAALLVGTWAATGAAQAGSLEDNFRAFIQRMKNEGRASFQQWNAPAPVVAQPVLERRTDSLPLGRNQFVLFVTNQCGAACNGLPERIKQKGGGEVIVMNLSTSQTAREAFQLAKAKGVPAVLSGQHVLSGYNDGLFERLVIDEVNERAKENMGVGGA
jgi:hypothetical protein